jgi:hypothetical protein
MDLPHIPEYPTQIIILNRLLCKSYLLIYGCPGGTVNDD